MATIKFVSQTHPTKSGGKYGTTKELIDYITNEKKTENRKYVGSQNCFINTNEQALNEMIKTKEFYGKDSADERNRMAYHFVISWSPDDDDITYEKAMEVAREFCQEYLDGYEAVYTVHTDKGHIHSHIAFNSVNAMTGLKYHYNNYDWSLEVQPILDKICKSKGLKTLEEDTGISIEEYVNEQRYKAWCKKHGKKFRKKKKYNNAGYRNETNEKYSGKDFLRDYIDGVVLEVNSLEEFFERAKSDGFFIREGHSEKHGDYFTMRGTGMEKARRNYQLGYNYTIEKLTERIEMKNKPLPVYPVVENYVYMFRYKYWRSPKVKLKPFQLQLYYGAYQRGLQRRGIKPDYQYYREAAKKLELKIRQLDYVEEYGISSRADIDAAVEKEKEKLAVAENELKNFYMQRKPYMDMVKAYERKKELKESYEKYLSGSLEYEKEFDEYKKCDELLEKFNHSDDEIIAYKEFMNEKLKELKRTRREVNKKIKEIEEMKNEINEDVSYDYEIPETFENTKREQKTL